jgi:putative ATPase
MPDLFTVKPTAPLAEALRPKTLDEVIGQKHLLGEGKPLRMAFASGKPHSMILWGPPGVGKTTLARLMATAFKSSFISLSAVLSGVKEIRAAVEQAQMNLDQYHKPTILFIDEIHRFNKSQQDALLPFVESGLVTFIGATTENPSFEVISALLSRAQVYVLQSLSEEELKELLIRAQKTALPHLQFEKEAVNMLVGFADGDARRLLNLLEQLETAVREQNKNIFSNQSANITDEPMKSGGQKVAVRQQAHGDFGGGQISDSHPLTPSQQEGENVTGLRPATHSAEGGEIHRAAMHSPEARGSRGSSAHGDAGALQKISSSFIKNTLASSLRRFDKGGENFYDQISALHKSVRGSHPDAALYWLLRMLDGGADGRYLARRIMRMAWEDIGLADPRAAQLAVNVAETYERLGDTEGWLALAQAVIYMSVAPKSNAGYVAYNEAMAFIKSDKSREVPIHLRNAPTKLMKELGYGHAYRYAHDEPDAYAAGETYLPDSMREPGWYRPVERGLEIQIKEKLEGLKEKDKKAGKK